MHIMLLATKAQFLKPLSVAHLRCCALPCHAPPGGFIKTVIRVLRCVGHYNSKILLDRVRGHILLLRLLLLLFIGWTGCLGPLINTVAAGNSSSCRASSKQWCHNSSSSSCNGIFGIKHVHEQSA
jgi:hypothetical protein